MLRLFSPLLKDDHKLWMRMQTAESIRGRVVRLLMMLISIIIVHSIAMILFEGLALSDALWLTMTTVTTVGYGDISAVTPLGRISTMVMLYVIGISLLAQVAGEFVEYRIERRTRMIIGRWRWRQMKNHILIINVPNADSERYLGRLVKQIRFTPGLVATAIQLLTPDYPEGLPNTLKEAGVVHRSASPEMPKELAACNASQAAFIIILAADGLDARSDAMTLDILLQLKDLGVDAKTKILAEAVLDENRERFIRFGADSVLRPVRAYPEILVRALVDPGSEVILEDLFTYGGVYPKRVEGDIHGLWGDIAKSLISANLGVPLGYISPSGHVVSSPDVTHEVKASALLLMVTPDHNVTSEQVIAALNV